MRQVARKRKVKHSLKTTSNEVRSKGNVVKNFRTVSKFRRRVSFTVNKLINHTDAVDGASVIGTNNAYHGKVFRLWLQSMYRNDYFQEWWNIYEWMLILLFAAYFFGEQTRDSFNRETRLKIVSVWESMSDEFVPLDNLSFYVTQTQDIVAIVFIFVCIHFLRIMQEVPYGIGARVMAILKVIPHKDVFPFYVTLIIMILSFAIPATSAPPSTWTRSMPPLA